MERAEMKDALAHVVWIGGATDSGKTSVARALAERHGWRSYHYDQFDRLEHPGHWARVDPQRHPWMHGYDVEPEAQWVNTTPERLVKGWLGTTPERFEMTLEDLLAMPDDRTIVAEGYGFLPELVSPLLSSPQQAIWLISTEAFKRASYARRSKGSWAGLSDPEHARRNHIERDLMIAKQLRERAEALGLTMIEIDGSRSLDEVIELVDAHLRDYALPLTNTPASND